MKRARNDIEDNDYQPSDEELSEIDVINISNTENLSNDEKIALYSSVEVIYVHSDEPIFVDVIGKNSDERTYLDILTEIANNEFSLT